MPTDSSALLLLEEQGWPSNAESKDSEEQLKESSLATHDSNSFTQERNNVFFLYEFGHLRLDIISTLHNIPSCVRGK